VTSLVERLGHPPGAKLLIVNCDDLGLGHAVNVGVYDALRRGVATSATLMVPCPWARDAAARYRGEDVGVHLTLNAEWDHYRWGPITSAGSLVDTDGVFPREAAAVWRRAEPEEVRRECHAQIERALAWGLDITHLDSHIHVLQRPDHFFDVYLELAVRFRLPLRLTGAGTDAAAGSRLRELAARAGVVVPDRTVHLHEMGTRKIIQRVFADLGPGVTEIYAHPAVDTPELRAFAQDWPDRVGDHQLLTDGVTIPTLVERAEATLIGYRPLRDLMRS
jgi:predicted glycoside hydrolase/deacetylase ChbG (UPF0249 family)